MMTRVRHCPSCHGTDQEAHVLADSDRRADERLLSLDAMEVDNGQSPIG